MLSHECSRRVKRRARLTAGERLRVLPKRMRRRENGNLDFVNALADDEVDDGGQCLMFKNDSRRRRRSS